jgi:flagellum-specific peptidoglycan hydrolase FlgJ
MKINNINACILFSAGYLIGVCIAFSTIQPKKVTTVKYKYIIEKPHIKEKKKKEGSVPLTEANLRKELKQQGIRHTKIVLAQAKLETGNFKSHVCRKYNNLFGLRKGSKGYHKFKDWRTSVKYYKNHIQSRYEGGDYYSFLSNIGYAEDSEYLKKLQCM